MSFSSINVLVFLILFESYLFNSVFDSSMLEFILFNDYI